MADEFNAFVIRDESGVAAAKAASRDRHKARQALSALDGVSVGVKDNIDVAGLPTRAGLGRKDPSPAAADAPVVAALRAAGCVIAGKTGMDEAALFAVGDNPHSGRVKNPTDPAYVAGGSSGGSAAAVAGGLAGLALGTDSLGSVRIPSAFCGTVGFKPTRDTILTEGVVPLAGALDHVGVIGARVGAVRLAMAVIVPALNDTTTLAALSGLKVGKPKQVADVTVEPAVAAAYEKMLADLGKAGAAIVDIAVPNWDPAAAARAGYLLCEAEASETFKADLAAEGVVSEAARKAMEFGRDCGNARLLAAFAVVQRTSEAWQRATADVDFLLLPTVPRAAFKADGPVPDDLALFTAPANIAGLPAITLPAGLDGNGLPVAVQLVAKRGGDAWLLGVAGAIEESLSGR